MSFTSGLGDMYNSVYKSLGGILPYGTPNTLTYSKVGGAAATLLTGGAAAPIFAATPTTTPKKIITKSTSAAPTNFLNDAYSAVDKYAFMGLLPAGSQPFTAATDSVKTVGKGVGEIVGDAAGGIAEGLGFSGWSFLAIAGVVAFMVIKK